MFSIRTPWRRWAAALALVGALAHALGVTNHFDAHANASFARGMVEAGPSLGKDVCTVGETLARSGQDGESRSPLLPMAEHCGACVCAASAPALPPGAVASSVPWRQGDRLAPQQPAELAPLFRPVPASRGPPRLD